MVKQKVTLLQGTKKDEISYYHALVSDDEDGQVEEEMSDESMEEGTEDDNKRNVQGEK
jgi:hypothetical protein